MTLKPDRDKSVNFDETTNVFIEGDNLNVLKVIRDSYTNRVNCIFIDPPYNTEKEFIYPDNFVQPYKAYQEMIGVLDEDGNKLESEEDKLGRKHTNWLNFMYARLLLAYDLLDDDGVIFVTIDDTEFLNLRGIMDEIFGYFLGQITYLTNPRGRSQDQYLGKSAEYVVVYSKKQLVKGGISITKNDDKLLSDYRLLDENEKRYRELGLRNSHREFGRFNRENLWYPFYVDTNNKNKIYVCNPEDEKNPFYMENGEKKFLSDDRVDFGELIEVLPLWDDEFEGCWTWSIDKTTRQEKGFWNYDLLVAKQHKNKWNIVRKDYAIKEDGVAQTMVKTLLTDSSYSSDAGRGDLAELFPEAKKNKDRLFQNPKAVELVKLLVNMGTKEDSIVMDFFAGSGTTAQAVMELNADPITEGNRKYVLVQLQEAIKEEQDAYKYGYKHITDLTRDRIKRAAAKVREKYPDTANNVDLSFKTFVLDKSNFPQWDDSLEEEQYAEQINLLEESISNPEDAVYEVLLLLRKYLLDAHVERVSENVYSIGDEEKTLVYLDNQLSDKGYEYIIENYSGYERILVYDNALSQTQKLNLRITIGDKFETL
ncbi:site-specific DNA-methyltransferase [Enterococcus sp. BWR-S5]|uniref:site-specific DNA-methyltransferase n=1 Tax=Enterococcus sp. BWR-S5 TaxID=2787714 RepID=UPI0019235CB8|nr:site-specific DNA-methyltransferase [Enterococcus sp. BWR-S5]MBL1225208.1 site-specific DNA-methyltransferase [Enterococcus sp. BWR-S5]